MRILVFYDLPTLTLENKKNYLTFRKFLVKRGFVMIQESVYAKLTLNQTASNLIVEAVKNNCPKEGLVQILVITERQFSKMEYICGEKKTSFIDNDNRLVIL